MGKWKIRQRQSVEWRQSGTYYCVKEWMLEAFADGDSLLGVNHETLSNQIFWILWKLNKMLRKFLVIMLKNSPDMSLHSGDIKLYFPSMILRNIIICLRCQKGGQPTRRVNMMTPQAQLRVHQCQSSQSQVPAVNLHIDFLRVTCGVFEHVTFKCFGCQVARSTTKV